MRSHERYSRPHGRDMPERAFLGALLGAGASLIGGLFGKSSEKKAAKKQQNQTMQAVQMALEAEKVPVVTTTENDNRVDTSSSIDLKRLVKEAEEAGYNPLTALRSGLASGYIKTTTTDKSRNTVTETGTKAGLAAQILGNAPAPQKETSMGEILAGAFSTGVSLYNDAAQKAALATSNDMRSIQGAYINGVSNRNAPSSSKSVFGIPKITSSGVQVVNQYKPGLQKVAGGKFSSSMPRAVVDIDVPTTINPFPAWTGIEMPKGLVSADSYEQMFSDPGSWLAGIGNMAAVANHNISRYLGGAYGPSQLGEMMRQKALSWWKGDKVLQSPTFAPYKPSGNRRGW